MHILYYKSSDHDIDEAVISSWLAQLPNDKRQRLERLQVTKKRLLSLIGWQLLRYGMQLAGNKSFSLQQLRFPDHGKPTGIEGWDFNLSHSGDLVACGICREGRIGIDVEHKRQLEPQRFKRYFTAEELNWMGHNADRFIDLWTRKEAVIKASGIGLKGLSKVSTQSNLSAHDELGDWYLHRLELDDDYLAHAATDMPTATIKHLQQISLAELVSD